MKDENDLEGVPNSFNNILPRNVFGASMERDDKEGTISNDNSTMSSMFTNAGSGSDIYRTAARRFYDPELTITAIYLPKQIRQKNRWRRWFYDHDEIVGAVLDLHAELPYSKAEVIVDDPVIHRHIEECLDTTNFFSKLPSIDLEYLKIGEVFIHNTWNADKGMWDHIVVHNPDYIEVKYSPFADQEAIIELLPDEELKSIIHSTKPEEQRLKRRLPQNVVKRVLTGKNIILDSDEITHIARRSNPTDVRGTSILDRIFRTLILEDKYREAQLCIADNFVYPLKLFKLGDKQRGWIPAKSHQRELAKMLQQANFDPNFALIYHYGLEVEYITAADKVFQLSKEWEEINNRKFIALGVSKELITAGGNFASANVGLQTQLARYRAKRDLFEELWIRDKFFRVMAERNGWYRRDAKEIVGQYRVSRSKDEMKKRLILPQLDWNKKLMMRDDQSYLTFLNNVFAQGRGPLSAITLLMAMGVDLEDELRRKTKQEELEKRYGMKITPTPPPGGGGIGGTGAPPIMASTKFIDRFKFGKKVKEKPVEKEIPQVIDNTFTGYAKASDIKYVTVSEEDELKDSLEISKILRPASAEVWFNNLRSSRVSSETVVLFNNFKNKLDVIDKKYEGDIVSGVKESMSDLQRNLVDIYMQGKMSSYSNVNNIPLYDVYYSRDAEVRDFSDLVLVNEFEDWVKNASSLENVDKEIKINIIRDIANTCFGYGQLKGYQEQGIYNVKVGNVLSREGFRYDVDDLLKKGSNLGSVLSPSGEIIVFSACINGFDKGGNNISPEFVRFKSFNNNGVSVKDCPIEYKESIDRLLNKFGKFIKKEFDSFVFVDDVTALDSWEREETKKISANFTDKDDRDEFIISANIQQERLKKRGKLPIFIDNRTVHLSNWIGVEDGSLNEKLINCLNLEEMESLKKAISKSFSSINFDLTEDELKTYKVFGYIDPIADETSEVIGWTVNDYRIKSAGVNGKLSDGKVWDINGKCLKEQITDPFQIFRENVVKYIDFPHKLSESLRESFTKLA